MASAGFWRTDSQQSRKLPLIRELGVPIRARVQVGKLQILAFDFSTQCVITIVIQFGNIRMKLNDCA